MPLIGRPVCMRLVAAACHLAIETDITVLREGYRQLLSPWR
ncbi:hypothetical protein BGE01nite_05920 [Brevifollis gellanilyticus]|uniref:Uncharacterized protein n=1 Tax=Brevifollis gellanilyticus TaxID=748831 RepID=A0A512M4P2_9BACT|nr:hypothetical protein BGE01nite_05920 [Brevifollis gellanilyticus]